MTGGEREEIEISFLNLESFCLPDKDIDVGRSSNFVIKYKVELIGKFKKKMKILHCILSIGNIKKLFYDF